MGSTWKKTWTTATAFHGHSGQFKAGQHERKQRSDLFDFLNIVKDTGSLVEHLREKKILPYRTPDGKDLILVQLNGNKGDRMNEGYKLRVSGAKPSR